MRVCGNRWHGHFTEAGEGASRHSITGMSLRDSAGTEKWLSSFKQVGQKVVQQAEKSSAISRRNEAWYVRLPSPPCDRSKSSNRLIRQKYSLGRFDANCVG